MKNDYDSLRDLDMEVHRINQALESTNDLNDINKLMNRLNSNQNTIKGIIDRIDMIKTGSIITIAYSLSKTKPQELKDYIRVLEKESNNSKYLDEIYKNVKDKLDYTETINNIKKKTDNLENKLKNKNEQINKLENKKEDNEKNLDDFNSKLMKFKDKLLKFQISITSLSNKVNNIKPELKTITKYFLGNIEIKNMEQLKKIAAQMSKEPNNTLSLEQIYNKLRARLIVKTESQIVPSNNFKVELLEQKTNLASTKRDILSTLEEVRDFKNEFENEYNDYLSSTEFYNYYSEIDSIENKLVNQRNKIDILDLTVDKSIKENDKKIAEIEKMELERQKQQKEKEEKEKQQKQGQQQNNQNQQNTMNYNQFNNINNYPQNMFEQYYGYEEPEQERNRRR